MVNDAIDVVKNELTAAKADVAELVSPEVVQAYTDKLDAVSFDAVENSRDTHYANHDLNDETVKSQIIDVDLKAISAAIAQIVEDAKAADKAAQEVPGDVNGDKALDAADLEIIEEFVVNGASGDEAEDNKFVGEEGAVLTFDVTADESLAESAQILVKDIMTCAMADLDSPQVTF